MTDSLITDPLYLQLTTTEPGGHGVIVRIQAQRCDDSGEIKSFESFSRTGRLSMIQAKLAGVTNAQIEDAPDPDVALENLIEFAAGCGAWVVPQGRSAREALRNAATDAGFVRFPGPGILGLDELAAIILPASTHRSLTELHRHLAGPAAADRPNACELDTLQAVLPLLEDTLAKLPLPVLSELNWMLAKIEHPLRELLKKAEARGVQEQFSSTFHSGKVSYEKLFKDFSKIIDLLRPEDEDDARQSDSAPHGTPQPKLLEAGEIRRAMGPQGSLGGLANYESRPEQEAMAERVAEAFDAGRHLLIEAGTGVGKSLAYLVPAILYAKRAGRPVMISTHTKNLQSQLYDKDIPFLKKHLGVDFEAAILRGRSNYLCIRKLTYTMQESAHELDDDERAQMLPVISWAAQTEHGEVSELTSFSPEQNPALWDRLHTVGDDCLKRACPFYKRCFVYKARGLARAADVVVLNHALVFSALNNEAGTLPNYSEIVFDEAHKLEDVATDHLACEIAPRRAQKILGRLFRPSHASGAGKGLLPTLLTHLEQARGEFGEPLFDSIREHILSVMQALQPANDGSELFFDVVRSWTETPAVEIEADPRPYVPMERGRSSISGGTGAPAGGPPRTPRRGANTDDRKRYSAQRLKPEEVELFKGGRESAISSLGKLRRALDLLEEDFPEIRKRNVARSRELLQEIGAQNIFLQELIHDIEFVTKGDEPNYVYWSERWGRKGARMVAAPLEIGALLFDQLYEKKRSIIFASATLSVRDAHAEQGSGLTPYRFGGKQSSDIEIEAAAAAPGALGKPHPKSFEFLKQRFGLSLCSTEKLDELLLGSPFDFSSQCRLCVPTYLPEPGGGREREFTQALSAMIAQTATITGGRALVLYTSYAALEASAALLRPALSTEGIEVLAQGKDGSRESLLAWLKAGGRKILLGTASFWEGVDVPGDALSLLIIAKLPFAVFTDPIVQGRCELLEAAGKDPFLHFSVPHAILKLRQGFGRLIRSKVDRGMVILADKRVITKRYGGAFLRALPAKAVCVPEAEQLMRITRTMFAPAAVKA